MTVVAPVTGEVLAEHVLVGPGETSIVDAHYDRPRPDRPNRAPRPRTQVEKDFCALGPVAEAFLVGAAAAGVSKLGSELADIIVLVAAHGEQGDCPFSGRSPPTRKAATGTRSSSMNRNSARHGFALVCLLRVRFTRTDSG